MLRKDWDDLDTNGQKGDWCFFNEHPEPMENGKLPPLLIGIRYGDNAMEDVCFVRIALRWREDGIPREDVQYISPDDKNCWEWDGNREAPTLSPSILVYGDKGPDGKRGPDRWHGWIKAGVLTND